MSTPLSKALLTSLSFPLPLARSSVHWRRIDDDIMVATVAGEYAGFIGPTPHGHEAHGARGEDLGVHSARIDAMAAVEASASPAASSSAGDARPTRPRRIHRRGTPAASRGPKSKGKTRWPLAP